MNRYTDITTSQYNPMSLQELMMAPAYKRNQHDNLLEASSALENNIAQVDPLEYHSQAAQEEQIRLQEQIGSQTELLNKEGFNPNSKQGFINLNKEYQKSISPTGTLGKINNAKKILAANKKIHVDQAVKEGFTPEQALMNWQKHEQDYAKEYAATGNISPIGQLGNPKYVDYLDTATKLFKDAGITERDLAGGVISKLITTDPRGQYILNEGGGKITRSNRDQLGAAVKWLNNNLQNPNSEIRQSIDYQGKSPNQVLSEIGNLAEVHLDDSVKSDYTRTMTGFKSAKELGVNNTGDLAYETTNATNIERFNKNLSSGLSNIIEGINVNVIDPSQSAGVKNSNFAIGLGPSNPYNRSNDTKNTSGIEKANFENSLNSEQKEEYDKIYEGLKINNPNLEVYDKYSKESASIVNNYIQGNANMLHQDIVITDDLVKQYGNSTGTESKNKKAVFETIKTGRTDRMYSINNQEYTYDQLPSDIKENFNDLEYSGYLSTKNFRGKDKKSNNDLYVSPHRLNYFDESGDRIEILVGRSSGERNSPDFKADRDFNNVYRNTKSLPNIPYANTNIGATVTYLPESNSYILRSKKDPSKVSNLDETSLQSMIYQLNGVKQDNK